MALGKKKDIVSTFRFSGFPENEKKDSFPSARGQKQNKTTVLNSRKMKF